MKPIDVALIPLRLLARGSDDLRQAAEAARAIAALADELRTALPALLERVGEVSGTLVSLRDEVRGVRRAIEPLLALQPELAGVRMSAAGLHAEVGGQRESIDALRVQIERLGEALTVEIAGLSVALGPIATDAGEIRHIMEPLEAATVRLGRLADRLPGPGRRRPGPIAPRGRLAAPARPGAVAQLPPGPLAH